MNGDTDSDGRFQLQSPPDIDFDSIFGLNDQLTELRETILESATGNSPNKFRTTTALFYGPKGAGKRRLAQATVGELTTHQYDWLHIESLARSKQQPVELMEEILEKAIHQQPAVIVLDCFDDYLSSDAIRKFQTKIDSARQQGDDIVALSVVDNQRMHGPEIQDYIRAMDVVLEMERPDIDRRRKILQNQLMSVSQNIAGINADAYDFNRLARETDRFGVDDLEMVSRRAAVTAQTNDGVSPPLDEDDIATVIKQVNEDRIEKIQDEATLIDVDVPEITFDDIGGHETAKRKLIEQVQQALTRTDLADELGVDFGGGILLHGPPGTGKTMLVRALANELDHTFISVNAPALKSGRSGPANQIPALFYRAQRNAPAILFFDEFDSLGTRRGTPHADENAVNTLLTELDGIQRLDQVVVIAATNRPKTLDPALLRPGRFDYHLEIGKPEDETQAEIFEKHTTDLVLASEVTPEWFAEMTDTVTGADIAAICERAVTIAMRGQEAMTAADVELSREILQLAYQEFEDGRLYQTELEPTPAFQ
ncbi:AAA family ATPase [Halorussus salinisoli]|uniref:AAA family ATPase n=1 Tax=Halorussus salinisoli TaxID=2558242 RepID=UPI0014854D64|nr:AAA family ATPase [Halorussus salinisoli]